MCSSRVTVVATGLGQGTVVVEQPPLPRPRPKPREPNYLELQKPTVQRKKAVGDGVTASNDTIEEMLDIPAFLRRQAD